MYYFYFDILRFFFVFFSISTLRSKGFFVGDRRDVDSALKLPIKGENSGDVVILVLVIISKNEKCINTSIKSKARAGLTRVRSEGSAQGICAIFSFSWSSFSNNYQEHIRNQVTVQRSPSGKMSRSIKHRKKETDIHQLSKDLLNLKILKGTIRLCNRQIIPSRHNSKSDCPSHKHWVLTIQLNRAGPPPSPQADL